MILNMLFSGLSMGTFYALMALGLSLIFGILKVVNFAHGEFFMIGAYIYAIFALNFGLSPWLAIFPAVVIGALVGIIVERLLMRPLYQGKLLGERSALRDEYAIIVTFALSIFLMNLAVQVFGPLPKRGPGLLSASSVHLGPIVSSGHRFAAFGFGVLLLVASYLFIRYSRWGKKIQAVAQNRFGASIAGVNTTRVSQVVFGVAGGLAALSGSLLCPIFHADPFIGALPAVKSFVIVVLGGMGSVTGAILGAYILGLVEIFGGVFISTAYQDAFGFVILILVLLLRPQGLFGEKSREV